MKFPARHFAARFAAKEAVSKAFGTGIGKIDGLARYRRAKERKRRTVCRLERRARKRWRNEREVARIWISLSHTEDSGMATIVLEAHDK